jgi:tetratricopeptide (TPR) repeat protein
MKWGRAQQFRENYEAAADCYRKATALCPDCGLASAKLGYCLYRFGRWQESIDAYENAFSIDSNFSAFSYISLSLSRLGHPRTATEYMERAFRNCEHLRNPANAAWWRSELGCMYATLGDWNRAAENFQLSADGEASASVLFNLAVALRHLGEIDRCIEAHRKAIELNPNHVYARYQLGIALAELGQFAESVEQLEIAVGLNPEDADTQNALESVRTKLLVR